MIWPLNSGWVNACRFRLIKAMSRAASSLWILMETSSIVVVTTDLLLFFFFFVVVVVVDVGLDTGKRPGWRLPGKQPGSKTNLKMPAI